MNTLGSKLFLIQTDLCYTFHISEIKVQEHDSDLLSFFKTCLPRINNCLFFNTTHTFNTFHCSTYLQTIFFYLFDSCIIRRDQRQIKPFFNGQ